jgi:hypothetical protein
MPQLTQADSLSFSGCHLPYLPVFPKLTSLSSITISYCPVLTDLRSPIAASYEVSSVSLINLPSLLTIPYWVFNNTNGTYVFQNLPLVTTFNLSPPWTLMNITTIASLTINTLPNITNILMPSLVYIGALQIINFEVTIQPVWPALKYCGSLVFTVRTHIHVS